MNRRNALTTLLALSALPLGASTPAQAKNPLAASALAQLQIGDIALIGVDGVLWTAISARYSRPEHRFGHVGVAVARRDGKLAILHAGGSPIAGRAKVRMDPAEMFFENADRIGIYRLRQSAKAGEFAKAAMSFHGVEFDEKFDLSTASEIYCTELPYLAARRIGIVLVAEPTRIGDRKIITPRDLEDSPALIRVEYNEASAG